MEIQEALKWTDDLIFAKTGKHLDSLQRAILEGTWEFRGYKDIADNYHCSPDHVRKMASELWELLSDLFGEDVKKKNVRALVENRVFSYFNNGVQIGSNINVCSDLYNNPKTTKERSHSFNKESQPRHDLSEAPEYDNRLYNRTDELTTLKQWILTENSRIVTITGLSGIGKTTLARQLVEQIRDNFDCILWRTHRKFPTLNALKTNLIEFFSSTHKSENPSILNDLDSCYSILDDLRSHRCLIILDDFQDTLTPREFVGNYLPEYQDYGKLLTEIGRSPHNSCLLLLSWEQPIEIANLETENRYCKTLQLQGLGQAATQLLADRKLTDQQKWPELIQRYSGNPLWLNIIASTIKDLFNDRVEQFLSYKTLFLGDIEPLIKQHYQRLSESEQLLMLWLANQDKTVNILSQPTEFSSDTDFLRAIQSLKKRSLIQQVRNNKESYWSLEPAIKEYVKTQSSSHSKR
ncbi:NB-ARC domain-containing protein [Planktothrix pseudagardhii]|uniref:WD repeat-containing protein alr2800 n=1 Tax=Planktothrix pseudagardhii TaxID=132604 RepID=A0A9W4G6B1_9CYAN|nr:NB-ARC domain-containing protein [Planktothrix pseudagardhii]CAD5944624.1 putative WD repeat-containing protein alr2800 [Planktothrix pseudagardhii]